MRKEYQGNVLYIIDDANKTVQATILFVQKDALNTINNQYKKAGLNFNLKDKRFLLNTTYSATAKCHDEDIFDVEKGKKIARKKAIYKYNIAKCKVLTKYNNIISEANKGILDATNYIQKKSENIQNEISEF